MADAVVSRLSAITSGLEDVKPTTCPMSLLKFPPSSEPTTLPPPSDHPTLAHPFTIPTHVYNAVLSPAVPITIALIYASVVTYVNAVNARRKYKPWWFSQTSIFKTLVLIHNAVLALYSTWTCIGMINALILCFAGWNGQTGVAGALDSLCKIHGPRGLGNAAIYNETSAAWAMTNRALHLAADGLTPERTDVGRIWNEGLAFYGWLFYLSKFYEVIDTAIILAKGKKSSFLQTYHHAGAMLCMWAGIRYMSPPIWMFVLVNSGIHAIMYTFYLCTVVRLPVPKKLKRALTTLQITQFVVGASYAFAHLFVAYRVPVSVPYIYHLGNVVSSVASEARSDAQSATSTAIAAFSTAGVGAWLKKAALRAAGREGLAENVLNEQGRTFGVDAVHIIEDFVSREEVRFRDELQWTHCLDTSGQAFAILLNCMYLAPLTWLFVQFFITAYLKRVERRRSSAASEKAQAARQSLQDASKGFTRRVAETVNEMHPVIDDGDDTAPVVDPAAIKEEAEAIRAAALQKLNEGVDTAAIKEEAEAMKAAALEKMNEVVDTAAIKENAEAMKVAALQKLNDGVDTAAIKENAEAVKTAALQKLNEGVERARKLKEEMGGSIDPFEQLQKKRAESVQRMRQSRSRSRDPSRDPSIHSPVRAASPRSAEMSPVEMPSITEKFQELTSGISERAQDVVGQVEEKTSEIPKSIQEMAAVTAALANLESDSSSEAQSETEATYPSEDYAEEYAEQYTEEEPQYEEYEEYDRPLTPIQEGSVEDHSSPAFTNRTRSEITPSPNGNGTGVEEASGASHAQMSQDQSESEIPSFREDEFSHESLGEDSEQVPAQNDDLATRTLSNDEPAEAVEVHAPEESKQPEAPSDQALLQDEDPRLPSPDSPAAEAPSEMGPSQTSPEQLAENTDDRKREEEEVCAQPEIEADDKEMATDGEAKGHTGMNVDSEEQPARQEIVEDSQATQVGGQAWSDELQPVQQSEEFGAGGDDMPALIDSQPSEDEEATQPEHSAAKDPPAGQAEIKVVSQQIDDEDDEAEKEAEEMSFIESPKIELEHPQLRSEEAKTGDKSPSDHAATEASKVKKDDDSAEEPLSSEPADKPQVDDAEVAQPQGDAVIESSPKDIPDQSKQEEPSSGEGLEDERNVGEAADKTESIPSPKESMTEDAKETESDKDAGKTVEYNEPLKDEVAAGDEEPADEEKSNKDEESPKEKELSYEEEASKEEASAGDELPANKENARQDEDSSREMELSHGEEAPKEQQTNQLQEASGESDPKLEPVIMPETDAATDAEAIEEPRVNGHSETNGVTATTTAASEEELQDKPVSKVPSMKSKSSLSLSVQSRHDEAGVAEEDDKENQQPAAHSPSDRDADSPTEVDIRHDGGSAAVRAETSFADTVKE